MRIYESLELRSEGRWGAVKGGIKPEVWFRSLEVTTDHVRVRLVVRSGDHIDDHTRPAGRDTHVKYTFFATPLHLHMMHFSLIFATSESERSMRPHLSTKISDLFRCFPSFPTSHLSQLTSIQTFSVFFASTSRRLPQAIVHNDMNLVSGNSFYGHSSYLAK